MLDDLKQWIDHSRGNRVVFHARCDCKLFPSKIGMQLFTVIWCTQDIGQPRRTALYSCCKWTGSFLFVRDQFQRSKLLAWNGNQYLCRNPASCLSYPTSCTSTIPGMTSGNSWQLQHNTNHVSCKTVPYKSTHRSISSIEDFVFPIQQLTLL